MLNLIPFIHNKDIHEYFKGLIVNIQSVSRLIQLPPSLSPSYCVSKKF